MTHGSALLAAGVAAAVLALVHASLPVLRRRIEGIDGPIAAAAAGGVSSAYVFIHLLPEIARGNEEIGSALGVTEEFSAVEEVGLFAAALGGFVLLYGLDHLAARRRGEGGAFAVHLGVFALYNALITYSLPTQFRAEPGVTVLFVVAMAVHFLISDRGLAERYEERFARTGRPVLVAALVGGFLLAWVFAPTSAVVVSALLAVLAGFVIFTVFSDELPSERQVRFPAFALAAGVYAALLLAVVVVEG